jgi:monofunctional biosynthetic peptidoglycan transglycosylase
VTNVVRYAGFSYLVAFSAFAYKLPTNRLKMENLRPASSTVVYDRKRQVFEYWFDKQLRLYRPINQIDAHIAEFLVFLEDAKFYQHEGFDVEEIKNSLKRNLEEGEISRGGSTITQQLAKNLFLDKERSFVRKIFEIPWAMRLEKDLTKTQILELYLNAIEWGPGIYGAEAAARHYFDRSANNLGVGQAMYLALIVPGPKKFDLFAHPKARSSVEYRRNWLVNRLVAEKKISPEQKGEYLAADFDLVKPNELSRQYPAVHDGSYFGSREKRTPAIIQMEKELKSIVPKNTDVQLTLDRELQRSFEEIEEIPGESKVDHTYALMEGDKVRAIRFVAKKRALDENSSGSLLLSGDLRIEKYSKFSWKRLLAK